MVSHASIGLAVKDYEYFNGFENFMVVSLLIRKIKGKALPVTSREGP
jgi:hypothetical protein